MNTPRPNRNPQNMRTLIQDMGRSIDEARTRRLGPPMTSPHGSGGGAADIRIGVAAAANSAPATPAAAQSAPSTPSAPTQSSFPPPPVRAATEMFSEGGPRLKARPKNAS